MTTYQFIKLILKSIPIILLIISIFHNSSKCYCLHWTSGINPFFSRLFNSIFSNKLFYNIPLIWLQISITFI